MENAVPIASTSNEEDAVAFQYTWPLKVAQRQIEDESIILMLSKPFATSLKNIQFTWVLKLTDEYVLINNAKDCARHATLHVYFKEGPCKEVQVEEITAKIFDPETNQVLFDGLELSHNEFTKGSGWPVHVVKERREEFTHFIHQRINRPLFIDVNIKMKRSIFEPLNYLPDVQSARSQKIETACREFIENVSSNNVVVPNTEFANDKFAWHRAIFLHGIEEISKKANESDLKMVKTIFAHMYFERVMLHDAQYLDDVLDLLEGVNHAHIPDLVHEIERFLCREATHDHAEMSFVKRLLLIAEKYELEVLKMVINGVLVGKIIGNSNPPAELVNITHELEQIANEMHDKENAEKMSDVVGVVLEDLQEMTRRVRRVSLSYSPSSSSHHSSSSPSATPSDGDTSPAGAIQPFDSPTSRFKRVSLV